MKAQAGKSAGSTRFMKRKVLKKTTDTPAKKKQREMVSKSAAKKKMR